MIQQLPYVTRGIHDIDTCLKSSSSFDRHVKARLIVVTLVASTAIGNIVLTSFSLGKIVYAAIQFLLTDFRGSRSTISLAYNEARTAAAGGCAVAMGGVLILAPNRSCAIYKLLSLYQPISPWRQIAKRVALWGLSIISLALLLDKTAVAIIEEGQAAVYRRSYIILGAYFVATIAYVSLIDRVNNFLHPICKAPGTIGSEENLTERVKTKLMSNFATKQLWERAQKTLTKVNGKPLSIAIVPPRDNHRIFHGQCRYWEGRVELDSAASLGMAEEVTVFELCNMCHTRDFIKVNEEAHQGLLSRDEYADQMELIERRSRMMHNRIARLAKTDDPDFPVLVKYEHETEEECLARRKSSGHTDIYYSSWDRSYSHKYIARSRDIP